MTIEAALFTLLSSAGSSGGSRFYYQRVPASVTDPYGRFFRVSPMGNFDTRGGSNNTPGSATGYVDNLFNYRYQLELYDDDPNSLITLENELRPKINGFRGQSASEEIKVFVINSFDDFDEGLNKSAKIMDLDVWHYDS